MIFSGFSSYTGRRECCSSIMARSTSSSEAFGVDGDDIVARHHDLARDHGFQVEHAVDHVLLRFGQISEAAAGTDDQLQLFGGVAAGMAAVLGAAARVSAAAERSITTTKGAEAR